MRDILYTVFALSLSLLPAQAEVIGENKWEFEEDGDGCYAGVLSHSADSRFQLATSGDRISGFIISKVDELDSLSIEDEIPIFGIFDDEDIIQLGILVLVGRRPFEMGSSEQAAWLMFTDPNLTGDRRMLYNETLTIYTLPIADYPDGLPLGTFSLAGSREVLTELAYCAAE